MKKKLTIYITVFVLGFGINANAQAVSEGDVLIDVYGGGPNIVTSIIKTQIANSDIYSNIQVNGVPCFGGRVSYMVADNISVGIDGNYTSTLITYTDTSVSTPYNYNLYIPRVRIMARFEFHFNASEDFDFYLPIGVGFNSTKLKFTSNDPYAVNVSNPTLLPIAFRLGIGGRYFFTDNLGLNLEFGLGGGPLVEGGLAFKF